MSTGINTPRSSHENPGLVRWAGLLTLVLLPALALGCAAPPDVDQSAASLGEFAFWPPFPAEPHVQFIRSYQYSDDVEPERSGLDRAIFGEQQQALPINKPYGVEMRDGRIYVCDTRNQGVIVLDIPGQETRIMGVSGTARFASPTDIAMADDGTIYVSDAARNVIFVFDADERHIRSIGEPGFQPTGLDVFGDELYVADFGTNTLQVRDCQSGALRRTIGALGTERGQFLRPLGVAVGPDGNVVVSDVYACRVSRFSPEGELLSSFGQTGNTLGNFVRPKHVDIDDDGNVYVVDATFMNIQIFNPQDELLMFFGANGDHPGAMYLPAGVAINRDSLRYFESAIHPAFAATELIVVTNQFGPRKVAIYALGALKPGFTAQDIAASAAEIDSGMAEDGATGGAGDLSPPPPADDDSSSGDSPVS